jgi:uncharacterized membrane protein
MDNSVARHILKTLSYRLVGTITTVLVAYYVSGSLEFSSYLGIGELVLKPIIYFLHERFWFKYIKMKGPK